MSMKNIVYNADCLPAMRKIKHIKDPDLNTDEFLRRQQRRLDYITKRIKIKGKWYDVGADGGRARQYLEDFYKQDCFQFPDDLNYKLTVPNDYFDTITHLEVIEHVLNPLFHMEECYRILKHGGTLFLTTPNDYSLIYKLEHLLSRKYKPHFHQFNERELRWLLEAAGFQDIKINTFKRSNTGYIARCCNNSFFVEATK